LSVLQNEGAFNLGRQRKKALPGLLKAIQDEAAKDESV